jgi:hypothetical protein
MLNDIINQITALPSEKLNTLTEKIREILEERERLFLAQRMTKSELLDLYRGRGYYPKSGDKFWKIKCGTGRGFYGWEVGKYEHSCHIDTSDFIVLLVIEPSRTSGGDSYTIDCGDMWLEGPIVV